MFAAATTMSSTDRRNMVQTTSMGLAIVSSCFGTCAEVASGLNDAPTTSFTRQLD
jgi:hypothetical protein